MADGQIIVTGASRGIGAAIAVELAARGFTVAALSRSGTAPAGYGIACDVTDEASLARAIAEVAARGGIAGLVNNAGGFVGKPSAELSATEFEQTIRLDATSVLIACREVYPHLASAGGGLIVNIGSFFDKLGVRESLGYCAAKAAVGAITRCLAVEWARSGIRVLDIAPGYVRTELSKDVVASEKGEKWIAGRVPLGRPGQPQEVAKLVGVLFSEQIAYLTGETIYIDGGHGIRL